MVEEKKKSKANTTWATQETETRCFRERERNV